jgi:hypothetical protein
MPYKVTALKDIRILANVPTPNGPNREEAIWISLKAGQVQDGLGMVWGLHPSYGLGQPTQRMKGYEVLMEPSWNSSELPKEFFGMYRLEISPISPGV